MYNKVIAIGNLTRDIELKYLPNGTAIAKGAIATSHKYKMQDGTQKEEVCFLEFSLFGKSAEIFNQYVYKGHRVMLEGRLIFEQWQDQNGQNRNRHTLRVEEFKFLETKSNNSEQPQQNYQQPAQQQSYQAPTPATYNNTQQELPAIDIDNDEIPF